MIMIDKIVDNVYCLYDKKKNELCVLLSSNTDTYEYIKQNYERIMNKWHNDKQFNMFDIPNCLLTISIDGHNKYYNLGESLYDESTIFDLASISKVYTEMMFFDFIEDYNLALDMKIKDVVSIYEKINDLTFLDLLRFNNTYRTDVDIRECTNKIDGLKALRTIYRLKEKEGTFLYTDLPLMVLTDIMEIVSKMEYKDLFDKYILKKYDLHETYLLCDNDKYLTVNKGYVNDPKANIMGGYYGHAGIRTTSRDFLKFFNKVLDTKYIDLFTTRSDAITNEGKKADLVATIGNINLSVYDDDSIASQYLTKCGIAVQGSVRCHAEVSKVVLDGETHTVAFCLFMDLYTQCENIKKYEKASGNTISREYYVDGVGKVVMNDIRTVLSYRKKPSYFKELINSIGKMEYNELYKYLKDNK